MTSFSPEHGSTHDRSDQPPENKEQEIWKISSDFEDEAGDHLIIEIDKKTPGLFLFDIDGTLVDARPVHGAAAVALYKEKFGLSKLDDEEYRKKFTTYWFSNFGLGDYEEHRLLCEFAGVKFSSEEEQKNILTKITAEYGEKIEQIFYALPSAERKSMLLPGVREFLEAMKIHKIPGAIVTGAVRQSAEGIIKYMGLAKYFITGGFDDDPGVASEGMRRANILNSAIEKCRQKGINIALKQTAVFGDTPKDFEATLPIDAQNRPSVFLIATGDHRFWDLAETHDKSDNRRPFLILPKLSDLNVEKFFQEIEKQKNDT